METYFALSLVPNHYCLLILSVTHVSLWHKEKQLSQVFLLSAVCLIVSVFIVILSQVWASGKC